MLVDRDVEKGKLEKSFLSFYFLSRATVSIEFHRHHYKASELKTRAFVLITLFHTTYPTTTTSIVFPIIAHLLCGPENVVTQ